jgi:hypothetical protein
MSGQMRWDSTLEEINTADVEDASSRCGLQRADGRGKMVPCAADNTVTYSNPFRAIALSFSLLLLPFFSCAAHAMPLAQRLDADQLDLDPSLIEESPVLQRWLEETPDLLDDIRTDPAFRTRVRAAYAEIDDESGVLLSIEDVFLGKTGLTLNGDYGEFEGDRHSWGVTLRYYTLPLGNGVNIAPLIGYRDFETPNDEVDGVELGVRLFVVPSRTGAADLSVSQSWINPGGDRQEVSLTTFTAGYAVTPNLRLSSDIQFQLPPSGQDTRFSVGLELML